MAIKEIFAQVPSARNQMLVFVTFEVSFVQRLIEELCSTNLVFDHRLKLFLVLFALLMGDLCLVAIDLDPAEGAIKVVRSQISSLCLVRSLIHSFRLNRNRIVDVM